MSTSRTESDDLGRTPWGEVSRKAVFATTHWSVVLNARGSDAPQAQASLGKLCQTYWLPLYAYVRRRGYAEADAQDLTQGFFAWLLERHWLEQADQQRGRFRSFLLTSGAEAGKGNAAGLQTLLRASRLAALQGVAVEALGQAAGRGNKEALKPLLQPENYQILRSSAVMALKPAADAGDLQAIAALAATAADQKQQALWVLVAHGLATAASAGNITAINSLATVAADENQNARSEAVRALEAAAAQGQPRAEAALQKLGLR